ncbi:DUF4190 domain-containing protein [Bifidobacterium aemilianum]|nr:DUF4190 domain-containing protein [Bifidobacterium aemilianum]
MDNANTPNQPTDEYGSAPRDDQGNYAQAPLNQSAQDVFGYGQTSQTQYDATAPLGADPYKGPQVPTAGQPAAQPEPAYNQPGAPDMTQQAGSPYQTYGQQPYQPGAPMPQTVPAYLLPQQNDHTNTLAIVSLVTSFFIAIVGLITGIISLVQIKKSREKGKGLAIAGVVISIVSMVVSMLLFLAFIGIIGAAANDEADSYSYSQNRDSGKSSDDDADSDTDMDDTDSHQSDGKFTDMQSYLQDPDNAASIKQGLEQYQDDDIKVDIKAEDKTTMLLDFTVLSDDVNGSDELTASMDEAYKTIMPQAVKTLEDEGIEGAKIHINMHSTDGKSLYDKTFSAQD